jgi:hypothetical protein
MKILGPKEPTATEFAEVARRMKAALDKFWPLPPGHRWIMRRERKDRDDRPA